MEYTYDGLPIAPENPRGASIVVYRGEEAARTYLILHRRHEGPGYEGDWAWGPPSGARLPGEEIDAAARRELFEETGLRLDPVRISEVSDPPWATYTAVLCSADPVRLSDEHDRFEWLDAASAVQRVSPEVVKDGLRRAIREIEQRDAR